MPRYYFDLNDCGHDFPDDDGEECADIDVAHEAVLRTLSGIVGDKLPNGMERKFIINVRDEAGTVVLTASMSLLIEKNDKS